MKKYRLIETNTGNLIAEFDDYAMDIDSKGNPIIEPKNPSLKEKQQHEDTMFLLREIFIMTKKIIKDKKQHEDIIVLLREIFMQTEKLINYNIIKEEQYFP